MEDLRGGLPVTNRFSKTNLTFMLALAFFLSSSMPLHQNFAFGNQAETESESQEEEPVVNPLLRGKDEEWEAELGASDQGNSEPDAPPGFAGASTASGGAPRQLTVYERRSLESGEARGGEWCRQTFITTALPDETASNGWICTPIPEGGEELDVAAAREAGRAAFVKAASGIGTVKSNPAADSTILVGMETFFWVDGVRNVNAQTSQDGFDLTVEGRPVEYVWDFGDGTSYRGTAGTAGIKASEISHTFERRAWHTITVSVLWEVTFTADGTQLGDPEQLDTTVSTELPVSDVVGILTQ